MGLTMDWPGQFNDTESISGDRRGDRRYQIQLDLSWSLIHRRKVQDTGCGRTLDLSSKGVLFEADRPLPVGLNVELSIAWPVLLHNVAPLQLVVSGRMVRCDGPLTALRITQHEFRTAAVPTDRRGVPVTPIRALGLLPNVGSSGFVRGR
jgi:hypothetical protein